MAAALVFAIGAFVVSAATTAYQVIQAKKAKKEAQAAADARKGFELVIEGSPDFVPIVYGRAMVGGIRTWVATCNNFNHVAGNADKVFMTGSGGQAAYSYNYTGWAARVRSYNGDDYPITNNVGNVSAEPPGYMGQSLQGGKNDFLCYQQILCLGPINAVRDVIIDQGKYLDDPSLGSYGQIQETSTTKKYTGVKAALRLDYHYSGSEVDTIVSANFPERNDAFFDRMAYVSAWFRLDRDEPQFNGVPTIQSLIEGRLVRWVAAGAISTTQSYWQNPAGYRYDTSGPLCLLDYMLDSESGAGYSLSEIDLPSFETADAVARTIAQSNVTVGGKFWKPTTGAQISTRDLPMYECNIIIDPNKPIRDNLESILSTMGNARLVWANGKYSLSLSHPNSNAAIANVPEFTDDDLVQGSKIGIAFPNASNRYNYATVRFHNEFENFAEDSVSWPPKYNNDYQRGIGAKLYSSGIGSWNDAKAGGRLLNQYAVWSGSGNNPSFIWKLKITADDIGTWNFAAAADDNFSLNIKNPAGTTIYSASRSGSYAANTVTSGTVNFPSAGVYTINASANNITSTKNDYKGFAASLTNASRILWTTRSISYDSFVNVNETNTVYLAMLEEDNNVPLEANIFAEGATDPYHALAKAEELVRTSRTATNYTFDIVIRDKYPQPGDFIRLRSVEADIGVDNVLYLQVESVKVEDKDIATIEATRFDSSQLAWNNKPTAYISPPSTYAAVIPQPYELLYSAVNATMIGCSGRLDAAPVGYAELGGYIFYMHRAGIDSVDATGRPLFTEIGRGPDPWLILPQIEAASAFFAVRAYSKGGKLSAPTTTSLSVATDLVHNWRRGVQISSSSYTFRRVGTSAYTPSTITLNTITRQFTSPVYEWYMDGTVIAGQTASTLVIAPFTPGTRRYAVRVYEGSNVGDAYYDEVILNTVNDSSPGAGTTVVLTPIGTVLPDILGNTVTKPGSSTAFDCAARGIAFVNSCFVEASRNGNDGCRLALGQSATTTSFNDNDFYAAVTSAGGWTFYKSGTLTASGTAASSNSLRLAYTGTSVQVWVDGILVHTQTTGITAGLTLYPKVLLSNAATFTNIFCGFWQDTNWNVIGGAGRPSDNATTDINLTSNGVGNTVSGNRVTKNTAGYDHIVYSVENATTAGTVSFVATASALGFIGLSPSQTPATPVYNDIVGVKFDNSAGTNFYVVDYAGTLQGPYAYAGGDRFDIVIDRLYLRIFKNGIQFGAPAYTAFGAAKYLKMAFSSINTVISQIQFQRSTLSWEAIIGSGVPGDYATSGPVAFPDSHILANWTLSGAGMIKATGIAGDPAPIYMRANGAAANMSFIQIDLPPNKQKLWITYNGRSDDGNGANSYVNGSITWGNADGSYNSNYSIASSPSPTAWTVKTIAVDIPVGAAKLSLSLAGSAGAGHWIDIAVPNVWFTEPAADITAGAQVTSEIPTANKTIPADYTGAVTSTNLGLVGWSPRVVRGGVSIKADNNTVYTLINQSGGTFAVDNTNGSLTKGDITISAMTSDTASCDLTITVNGVAQPKLTITVVKVRDAPPVSGGGGGGSYPHLQSWSGGEFVGINTETYTPIVTAAKTVTLSTGQSLYGIATLDYYVSGQGGIYRTMTVKWQYSVAGANSWNDFAAGVTGTYALSRINIGPPDYESSEPEPGSVDCTQTKSGLAAGDYDVRLVAILNATGRVVTPGTYATVESKA